MLVKGRDREEIAREEQPHREECQHDVEGLAYDVEPQHLAALHLLYYLLEVRVQSDAGERQHESPVLVLVKHLGDRSDLVGSAKRLDEEGGYHRGEEESEDELREAVPDLTGADFRTCVVNLCREEDRHEEGDESDQDVLDGLHEHRGLLSLRAESRTRHHDRAGGIHGASDQGSSHDLRHSASLDDHRLKYHHDDCEYDGDGHRDREVVLLGVGGCGCGDRRAGSADTCRCGHGDDQRLVADFKNLGSEPPHEQDHDRGHDPCYSKAVEAEFGDVGEQYGESHDHQAGLDVELRLDGRLQPVRDSDRVGDQKTDQKRPEGPFEVAVEGIFSADEAHHKGDDEESYDCGDIFPDASALKLDTNREQRSERDEGHQELAPENPGSKLLAKWDNLCRRCLREILPEGPGGEFNR